MYYSPFTLSWPHCALNARARCISLASKRRTRSIRGRGLFRGRELFEEIRYIFNLFAAATIYFSANAIFEVRRLFKEIR